ncbi:hypothetical protein B9Z19DRAFT_1136782 [Tuber borchii]|uniref:Uncharacterized protein n=1 Tax=Tuber borchii TaxID=42251 RepID=A0A2T6ZB87_TUBBO|nr:hypothetical protein B9Z19DRAFT_1136782 [Tuber borchii]
MSSTTLPKKTQRGFKFYSGYRHLNPSNGTQECKPIDSIAPRARTQPIPLSFGQRSPGHAPAGSEFFDAARQHSVIARQTTGRVSEGDSDIGGTEAPAGAGVFFVTLVFPLLARLLLRKGKGNSRGKAVRTL